MVENLNSDNTLRPLRILVVDDSRSDLILMGRILCNFNCEYDFSKSGVESLEKLESDEFNLMLTDCQMPLMDGHTAVNRIRESGRCRKSGN